MTSEHQVLSIVEEVNEEQLRVWIAESWVRPSQSEAQTVFNEADIARIRLLCLLVNDLCIGDEAIPIVLSLIDQIHDMRSQIEFVADAIEAQPEDIKRNLLKALDPRS